MSRKLGLKVKWSTPDRDTCLGEWLARMLHPEFFTAADDIYSAMAAADRALGEQSREENVLDKRIEELQAELAALRQARKAG